MSDKKNKIFLTPTPCFEKAHLVLFLEICNFRLGSLTQENVDAPVHSLHAAAHT